MDAALVAGERIPDSKHSGHGAHQQQREEGDVKNKHSTETV